MPLLLPDLDDRRWADLVEEGRSLIPLYAPGWTDHNVHDPGITLVELLAGQAELDLYRINRVPPAHVRKFLALVGAEPRPPRAARTVLAFCGQGSIPAGLEIEAEDLAGVRTVFRTLDPVTVVDLALKSIQTGGPGGLEDLTARWLRGEEVALLGDDPAPGTALYLGFDRPLPVGIGVSLVFTLAGKSFGWEERERLIEEARRAAEACPPPGPVPPCHCGDEPVDGWGRPSPGEGVLGGPGEGTGVRARTAWEIQVGPGIWRRLDPEAGEVVDETRSLTLDGRVVLTVPAAMSARKDLFYLRCRFAGGALDAPPGLVHLALNGVAAIQAESVAAPIGEGSGEPHQQLALPKAAVLGGTVELSTLEDGKPVAWTRRLDFDLSGRGDSHFLLDPDLGRLTFGDGERGRRIPPKAPASVRYLATRAAGGNLPAGLTFPKESGVRNPVPSQGGAAAETLDEAAASALESVDRPMRAVTLDDYERLALETPGVRLARAMARANFDPAFPCFQATGVITVIVLPFLPRSRPFPSAGTRRAVAGYLARRRLIGTRVTVIGPSYLEVAVRATVRSFPGTDPAELKQRIAGALDGFFHPLTGGPAGGGWPLGRDVYRSEVLQVLDETPGVDHVLKLELIADGKAVCGNVCVGPTSLVAAGAHEIEVEGQSMIADIADPNQIQRLRFTPGQDLLSRDFRDGETFATRLREWHNRALHGIYGVASGLRVVQLPEALLVARGLAYDATGRELILPATKTLLVPDSWKREPFLVIRQGAGGAGELGWSSAERLQPCDAVPLARLVENNEGNPVLDDQFLRPLARPLARPRIGYGSTIAGGTAWQAEVLTQVSSASPLLVLHIQVDTRAAGFTRPPCYFAWLQGGLLYPYETDSKEKILLHLPLFPSLAEEKQTGFRLRVLALSPVMGNAQNFRKWGLATAQQSLSFCWLGIQREYKTLSLFEVSDGNP